MITNVLPRFCGSQCRKDLAEGWVRNCWWRDSIS